MRHIFAHPHFAFNVWDYESAKTVIGAASNSGQEVILQTSVSIYKALEKETFLKFVHAYAEEKEICVWLNLDHCRDVNLAKDAVDNGWDMVMLDASQKTLTENIKLTNDISEYAHRKGALVEAEIGEIMGTEDDIIVRNCKMAEQGEIAQFLDETVCDCIAVAFGNAHGRYYGKPMLHFDIVQSTIETGKPFVVHGGSGMSDEDLTRLLRMGVKKINISTDLKNAFYRGLNAVMQEERVSNPFSINQRIYGEVYDEVIRKLLLITEMQI